MLGFHIQGHLLVACCFLVVLFDPEDRGAMLLENAGEVLLDYLALCSGK
jgi:hypothetical protein